MNNDSLVHVCSNDLFQSVLVHDVYSLLPTVLKVSVKEDNGNESSVTVRLYGPNTDLVIDRKRELQVRI
jgi:outer membrane receptor for ferrienterochelin and colicin